MNMGIKLFKTELNMDDRDWYLENFHFKHIRIIKLKK